MGLTEDLHPEFPCAFCGAQDFDGEGHAPDCNRARPADALVCWDCGTPIVMRADGAEKPCGHTGTLVVTLAEWARRR